MADRIETALTESQHYDCRLSQPIITCSVFSCLLHGRRLELYEVNKHININIYSLENLNVKRFIVNSKLAQTKGI